MRRADLDLPLADMPASRFLIWITAGLVYLCVIAVGIASVADRQLEAFARQPRIVTVALPPNPDPEAARADVDAILEQLVGRHGVAYTSLIDEDELGSLVQPWLGADAIGAPDASNIDTSGIPLPRLIDIAYNPGTEVDLPELENDLSSIVPGATIGDAGLLQRSQERLALLTRNFSFTVGILLLGAVMLVVGRITKLSLDLSAETVDLLRLMGAKDGYIARQFEHHALAQGLRGAIIGFTAAILTLSLVLYLPTALGGEPVFADGLTPIHWVLLAIVPVLAALLTALAGRLTAHFGLASLR